MRQGPKLVSSVRSTRMETIYLHWINGTVTTHTKQDGMKRASNTLLAKSIKFVEYKL